MSFLLQYWKFAFWMSLRVVMAIFPRNDIFFGTPCTYDQEALARWDRQMRCKRTDQSAAAVACLMSPPANGRGPHLCTYATHLPISMCVVCCVCFTWVFPVVLELILGKVSSPPSPAINRRMSAPKLKGIKGNIFSNILQLTILSCMQTDDKYKYLISCISFSVLVHFLISFWIVKNWKLHWNICFGDVVR